MFYNNWVQNSTIDKHFESELKDQINFWRNVLHRVINVIITLASCNLALRGHDEKSGNFQSILRLISDYDPVLRELFLKPKGKINYLSPSIQNEIVNLLGREIREKLIADIKCAPFFSIITDTTQDISKLDQLSQIFRYVVIIENNNIPIKIEIRESFLGFKAVADATAVGLRDEIMNSLRSYNIDVTKCRGQGYDGANVMSGAYAGLQTLIKDFSPNADYVHCAAHSLNLILNDGAKNISEISVFFDDLEKIYTFFGNSIKRWALLNDPTSEKVKITLKRVCPTRWSSRNDALFAVKTNYLIVMKTLCHVNLVSKKKDERDECQGIIKMLENFEFILLVSMFTNILKIVNPLSKALQCSTSDLQQATILLENLLKNLKEMRSSESFIALKKDSEEIAKQWRVAPVFKNKRRRIVKRFFDEMAKDERIDDSETYFKINVFYQCLDIFISQLEQRFQSLFKINASFKILQPKNIISLPEEILKSKALKLVNKYRTDLSDDFCNQLISMKLCLGTEITKLQSIKELAELILIKFTSVSSNFSEVITACLLFLTLPVTVATAERSFSKLKLIKSYLRNSMSQERLADLAIMSIEKNELQNLKSSPNMEKLINAFAEKKARKASF